MIMKHSEYQLNIFDWVANAQGHGSVNAVAGSGKTSTAIDSLSGIDMFQQALLCAFNSSIKKELESRTKGKSNVSVKTYNGLGWGVCLRNVKNVQLEENKTDIILKEVLDVGLYGDAIIRKKYQRFRSPVKRLVSLYKGGLCRDLAKEYPVLLEHHDISIPNDKDFESVVAETYMRCVNTTNIMDFDDQVFMPLSLGWILPKYDFIMVDEFQDTNLMQTEMMSRCLKNKDSRMMVFGDPWQAIYGFRGATPGAMETWKRDVNATELPLSICYRCPKSVVREAQRLVPHIEYASDAGEGNVKRISVSEFNTQVKDRDFVLCRTTEPLIRACLNFIRQGRAASVRGREVGDQLVKMVEDIAGDNNREISTFSNLLDDYYQKKHANLIIMEQERRAQELTDKVAAIRAIMETCKNVTEIVLKITDLFDDQQTRGIQLMTCHKSKGLQNPNVYVLNPEQLESTWNSKKQWQKDEQNRLKYVTITRAQENLFWVN